jgi:HK97 family phage prohead protease
MSTHYGSAIFLKRAPTSDGSFEGWASTYGNIDAGGDKVMPGAFAGSLRKSDRVRLLLNHDPDKLVGWGTMEDRPEGLLLRGQLDLLDPSGLGKYVHHKMLTGELSALSIGYSVDRGGARINDEGVRELTSLKLWEVSIVAFPMNELAAISAVKLSPLTVSPDSRVVVLPPGVELVSAESLTKRNTDDRESQMIREALRRAFAR